jgi:hypothetical protein
VRVHGCSRASHEPNRYYFLRGEDKFQKLEFACAGTRLLARKPRAKSMLLPNGEVFTYLKVGRVQIKGAAE